LPYSTNALEPAVDNETMSIHHDKHFAAYVTAMRGLVANNSQLQGLDLAELQSLAGTDIVNGTAAKTLQNSGGGAWNHALFFKHLAPPGTEQAKFDTAASAELQDAIDAAFGNFTSFQAQFSTAAASVFGSGWAWLIMSDDDDLAITTSPNQNNPLQTRLAEGTNTTAGIPIMGIDVWEHAYYLKHQSNRAGWIANFFLVLNWAQISENYQYAAAGGVPDTSEAPMLTSFPRNSSLPCPCSLPAGYDVNQDDLASAIRAAGDCPADVSNDCPSGNFGYNNKGGCGNIGCFNSGTGNIGNNNTGTANKGDNNNGSNNVGRCPNGSGLTGDQC